MPVDTAQEMVVEEVGNMDCVVMVVGNLLEGWVHKELAQNEH